MDIRGGNECDMDLTGEPQLDLETFDGEVNFSLTLNLHGVWNPQFHFPLLPVGLKKTDILESKVKDLQEENALLREEVDTLKDSERRNCLCQAYMSLSSSIATSNNNMISWNDEPRDISVSHFNLSDDCTEVAIEVTGVYQVQVRLAVSNSANGNQSMFLMVNSVNLAGCTQSNNNGYQNTPQLFEILRLRKGDILGVKCFANNNSLAVALANRFTILYLGN